MMSSDPTMYTDTPTIASEPIYVGPPTDLTLEEGVGEVRVWSDQAGRWIDEKWKRDGRDLTIYGGSTIGGVGGTVRVVEMLPAGERDLADSLGGGMGMSERGSLEELAVAVVLEVLLRRCPDYISRGDFRMVLEGIDEVG